MQFSQVYDTVLCLATLMCCWNVSILAISPSPSPSRKTSGAFIVSKSESARGIKLRLFQKEDGSIHSFFVKPEMKISTHLKFNNGNTHDKNDVVSDDYNNDNFSKELILSRRRAIRNLILSNAMGVAAATAVKANANAISFSNTKKEIKPTTATDVAGNPITAASFLSSHKSGDRTLVQGLKGDPTYLIVRDNISTIKDDNGNTNKKPSLILERYALNAECTHLGCIVPWDPMQSKFVCPCHGSQYSANGTLLRGPAPYSLKLAAVEVDVNTDMDQGDRELIGKMGTGRIILSQWDGDDFRTGEKPWWI